MNNVLTLGADPELMLFDPEARRIVSAIPILKDHNKHRPINLSDGGKMYWDCTMIEFQISPSRSKQEMIGRLREVFRNARKELGHKYRLLPKSAHLFDADQLREPEAHEIGCVENYDVYERRINLSPPFADNIRTSSFHLHLGHPALEDIDAKGNMVKLMDIYVACASVIFDQDPTVIQRRKLYGRAGEFRPTSYGVEARQLGSGPLSSPVLTELVLDLTTYAIDQFLAGKSYQIIEKSDPTLIRWAINQNDKDAARSVMKQAQMPDHFIQRIEQNYPETVLEEAWGIE